METVFSSYPYLYKYYGCGRIYRMLGYWLIYIKLIYTKYQTRAVITTNISNHREEFYYNIGATIMVSDLGFSFICQSYIIAFMVTFDRYAMRYFSPLHMSVILLSKITPNDTALGVYGCWATPPEHVTRHDDITCRWHANIYVVGTYICSHLYCA